MKGLRSITSIAVMPAAGLCLASVFTAGAAATRPAADTIRWFDQVAPGEGWAASMEHVYWTADDGRQWSDITPERAGPKEPIGAVFFADRLHGWVPLLRAQVNRGPGLQVAMTVDGGASWSYAAVDLSRLACVPSSPPSVSSLEFSGADDGWMMIDSSSGPLSRRGSLFHTADGGLHWMPLPTPPLNGAVSFGSAENGVMTDALNPYDSTVVWYSRNGGRAWTGSQLPLPDHSQGRVFDSVSRANYFSAESAELMAVIRTPGIDDFERVNYRTEDGGATWVVEGVPVPLSGNADLKEWADGHRVALKAAPDHVLVIGLDKTTEVAALPASISPGDIDAVSVANGGRLWLMGVHRQTGLLSIDLKHGSVARITP